MEKLQVRSGDVLEFGPDGVFHPVFPDGRVAMNSEAVMSRQYEIKFVFSINSPLALFLCGKSATMLATKIFLGTDKLFVFDREWLEPGTRLELL